MNPDCKIKGFEFGLKQYRDCLSNTDHILWNDFVNPDCKISRLQDKGF